MPDKTAGPETPAPISEAQIIADLLRADTEINQPAWPLTPGEVACSEHRWFCALMVTGVFARGDKQQAGSFRSGCGMPDALRN